MWLARIWKHGCDFSLRKVFLYCTNDSSDHQERQKRYRAEKERKRRENDLNKARKEEQVIECCLNNSSIKRAY